MDERRQAMSIKGLAEGIILQSIEDLWSESHRGECIAFFTGREFSICAEMAGMDLPDQLKVLNLVKTVVGTTANSKTAGKDSMRQRGKSVVKGARKAYRHIHAVQ
jgi:hypothetical protein